MAEKRDFDIRAARRMAVCLAVVLALLPGIVQGENPADPLAIVFPYQWKGNIDTTEFNEPSGIVFHPGRGTLFVVGDAGDLGEFRTDGTPVEQQHLRDADFEGATYDPATGLLYIAVEGEEKILEVDPEDFDIRREFVIDRIVDGKEVLKERGRGGGIEGITFVPDAGHPEGGVFFVTNQAFDLDAEEDLSAVCEVELPLRSSRGGGTVKIRRFFTPGVIDLSGIYYDGERDLLYVISDANNAFFEITREGKVLRSYALPAQAQEGIAVDGEGFLYIAQDSGGIVKYQREASMKP